ncbi:(R)-mandelonitrile lyase [Rhodovibrio salinarum]|uniref:Cupin domain-containing protein n=1 Tax=Rhodovibrio salinarum TaxID=1087 RepID=A0A934UZ56_9PROT|nr:cupin domain-containing protein [Rhodovibrio salinarum]MBK1696131.1 cupin domain-containing protein [Rhodovibrio salinarum]
MKRHLTGLCAAAVLAAAPAMAQDMEISENGSRDSFVGPDKYFTGTAVVDRVFAQKDGRNLSAGRVTFAPGARSNWHTHPAGQTLIVTSGTGWVQQEGGEKRRIQAGDVVWTPAGVKHWHGATDSTSMGHIALQAFVDGENVKWLEAVSDDQYLD